MKKLNKQSIEPALPPKINKRIRYSDDVCIESSIDDAIQTLKEIQEKLKDKANVRLSYERQDWSYDDSKSLMLFYDELETDKEYEERMAELKKKEEDILGMNRKELARLKKFFGED